MGKRKLFVTITLCVILIFSLGAAPAEIQGRDLKASYPEISELGLTEYEAMFLFDCESITIGWLEDSMPFSNLNDSGKADGVIVELADCLQYSLQVPVQLKSYKSYEELFAALATGEIDAAFPVFSKFFIDTDNAYYLTEAVYNDRLMVVYNGKYDDDIYESVAVTDGSESEVLKLYYPEANTYNYYTTENSFRAVRKGQVRSSIGSAAIYQYYINQHPGIQTLSYSTINIATDVCFAVHRDEGVLCNILSKAILNMEQFFLVSVMMNNSNGSVDYSLGNFIKHNFYVVVAGIFIFVVLLIVLFIIYQKVTRDKERLLNEALREAKRSEMAKTEFLSHMSHDIRTPINGIIGMLDMSERSKEDVVKLAEYREKIRTASNHLLSLINDVLDMSRISSNRVELEEIPFDIRDLVESCKVIVTPMAEEFKVTLNEIKYVSVDEHVLIGSPLHLRQVLVNIISNSIKYNVADGWVKVSVSEKKHSDGVVDLALLVSDSGIGMSADFVERIFEPFSREHAGEGTTYTGTGLGMPIVKEIIDKMGGTIEIKSEVGKGSSFLVTVPFKVSKEALGSEEEEEKNVDISGLNVLLVEDNELNMEIADFMLSEAGVNIFKASNGQMAVDMVKDNPTGTFDIVLMDVMMPVMDGLTATRAIRDLNDKTKSNIPIIAMTANAFKEDEKNCLEAGMNEHLAKPLEFDKVIAAIGRHVNKKK